MYYYALFNLIPVSMIAMYKFFGMNFFNFMSEWFYNWSVVVMDVMNQKRNMNNMFFTVKKK